MFLVTTERLGAAVDKENRWEKIGGMVIEVAPNLSEISESELELIESIKKEI